MPPLRGLKTPCWPTPACSTPKSAGWGCCAWPPPCFTRACRWGGLAALLLAQIWIVSLDLPESARSGIRLNALLTGLALAALWAPEHAWWLIFPLAVSASVLFSLSLGEWLWRAGSLPALSLSFSCALWLTLPVLGGMAPAIPEWPHLLENHAALAAFLSSLGWIFLSPHPVSGALILIALLMASRWLTLLAVGGYLAGQTAMNLLAPESAVPGYAFNFPLAAMAVGGVFCLPGLGALVLGMLAALLTALMAATFAHLFMGSGAPALSAPFVIAVLLTLTTARHARRAITPMLAHPALPEEHAEAARLARSRLGAPGSLPLALPFMGAWQVYQGFDGPHTHRRPWQHALDFFLVEAGKSYRHQGQQLNDYLCYGLPLLAPVSGEVVRVRDGLPDNPPGQVESRVDNAANWGNHVVIRTSGGLHVWLAHLRQGSLAVQPGTWVRSGEVIAACGNSGRSPQPHLHLHVQAGAGPGEPTLPFHLDNVLAQDWHLARIPLPGDTVANALPDAALRQAFALQAGRRMGFEVRRGAQDWHPWQLEVVLTLDGQIRLSSKRRAAPSLLGGTALTHTAAASIAAISGPHAFALFDRRGGQDPWLDLFSLALGLTPFSEKAGSWTDAPPARLFPMRPISRCLLWIARPLGASLTSRYQRRRESWGWRQRGQHTLAPLPGWLETLETEVEFTPDGHVRHLRCHLHGVTLEMRQIFLAQTPDAGIPAWRMDTPVAAPPTP